VGAFLQLKIFIRTPPFLMSLPTKKW